MRAALWRLAIDHDVFDSRVGIDLVAFAFAWDGDEDTQQCQ